MNTTKMAARLRAKRRKSGLSLRDLAAKVGVTKTHLSFVETGHRGPSEKLLRALCKELELEFDALVRLRGHIPDDVERYIVRTPGVLEKLRKDMEAA